jgi:hypothetical protein
MYCDLYFADSLAAAQLLVKAGVDPKLTVILDGCISVNHLECALLMNKKREICHLLHATGAQVRRETLTKTHPYYGSRCRNSRCRHSARFTCSECLLCARMDSSQLRQDAEEFCTPHLSLINMCRTVIRREYRHTTETLNLPESIQQYLRYDIV